MHEKILQLESTLMTTRKERDKTLKELSRLKQHLLDKVTVFSYYYYYYYYCYYYFYFILFSDLIP